VDGYVSSPANMVQTTFSTPQLEPGESGSIVFTLLNRYVADMTEVHVEFEVYRAANEEESRDVLDIKHPPTLTAVGHSSPGDGTTKVDYSAGTLVPGQNATIELRVKTKDDTYEATYLVRTRLTFSYTNDSASSPPVEYRFVSRGHFTDEQWKAAEDGPSFLYTNLDLTALNVSGIFPDTSFGVRSDFPQWPKYVFLAGAAGCAGLAGLFIAMENYGMFPKLKERLDSLGKKNK